MTTFDYVLLFIGIPWALVNIAAAIAIASKAYVRSIELKFAFFIPFTLLLLVAYRVWG